MIWIVSQPSVLREQCTPYVSPVQALLAATEGQHVCGALGVVLSGEINSDSSRAAGHVPPPEVSALQLRRRPLQSILQQ